MSVTRAHGAVRKTETGVRSLAKIVKFCISAKPNRSEAGVGRAADGF